MSESTEETTVAAVDFDENSFGAWPIAAMGSVAMALYYYYIRDDKQRGQFIGLWPATILGLAVYIKLDELTQMVHESSD